MRGLCKKGRKGSFLRTHPELNRTAFAEPSKCEADVINTPSLIVLDIRCNVDLARQAKSSYALTEDVLHYIRNERDGAVFTRQVSQCVPALLSPQCASHEESRGPMIGRHYRKREPNLSN